MPDITKIAEALRREALAIFDGPETAQETRDVIEWYTSSLQVAAARQEPAPAQAGTVEGLAELRRLIANDAHACTFQTLGQYRSALLRSIAALASREPATVAAGTVEGLAKPAFDMLDLIHDACMEAGNAAHMRLSLWFDLRDEIKRLAALASREAQPAVPQWQPIKSAPHGVTVLGVVDGQVRLIHWAKTSHVPMYGWCLADQGAEDFDFCDPTHWMPLPAPPDAARTASQGEKGGEG